MTIPHNFKNLNKISRSLLKMDECDGLCLKRSCFLSRRRPDIIVYLPDVGTVREEKDDNKR